jgi:hypothetical protein
MLSMLAASLPTLSVVVTVDASEPAGWLDILVALATGGRGRRRGGNRGTDAQSRQHVR